MFCQKKKKFKLVSDKNRNRASKSTAEIKAYAMLYGMEVLF